MIIINFDEQFSSDVEDGMKTQTIRRNAVCKRGDNIQLNSGERKLADAVCTGVKPIIIDHYGIILDGARLYAGSAFRDEEEDRDNDFAKKDGFSGFSEMADWFSERYGLPFEGHLIQWRPS